MPIVGPTPGVTLVADLESILGGAQEPGYLRVTLIGFGPVIPVVPNSGVLADAGVPQLKGPQGNTAISILLYGNDVITPGGTLYEVAVLDSSQNVVQSGLYQFGQLSGPNTVDLTVATQIQQPPIAAPWQAYLAIIWTSAGGNLALSGVMASTFDITLDASVGTLTVGNFAPGTLVQFIIQQDATGNRAFPWPANVKNPPLVDMVANSITTALFTARANGNLYPILGWS